MYQRPLRSRYSPGAGLGCTVGYPSTSGCLQENRLPRDGTMMDGDVNHQDFIESK